ncbi:MAG TPA: hypothetical protein VJV04_03740 [Nitrospiraceae bacterium]|nr:hypothetical protein [Nitrospiraceae bacterium]
MNHLQRRPLQCVLAMMVVVTFVFTGTLIHAQAHSQSFSKTHHQSPSAKHASVFCAWLCAAGHLAAGHIFLLLPNPSPLTVSELLIIATPPDPLRSSPTSRGPPLLKILLR